MPSIDSRLKTEPACSAIQNRELGAKSMTSRCSNGRPLRILEFIDTLDTGGAERMVSGLSLCLREMGNDVYVVCLRDLGLLPIPEERFLESGVSLTELGKKDGFSPAAVWKLACFLRAHRIEVIHSHNPLVTHYAAAAAKIARTPVGVSTIHGTSTLGMPRWAESLFAYSAGWNDRIVLVCGQVEEVFQQRYARLRNRTTVIWNGIDFGDLLSVRRLNSTGEFVFGTIGRLTPVKDQQTLLAAFAQVRVRFPSCRLEVLGGGELMEDLKQLAAQLGIESAVKFHGWSRDIAGFLARLDAFVLSSKSEGLPMTLLEAMAAGLPAVATAVGGIPEVIESVGCGWLAKPGDAASLADQMIRALTTSDLRDKGERARQAVTERYSVRSMSDQYYELFGSLLAMR
jgi:glycosyltransferase involved in cell wall biosynthesis